MRTRILAFVAIAWSGAVFAQSASPTEQLPDWARQKWSLLSKARALDISTRLNPFVWRGDFDGDGRQDLALFVRATSSGKEGIAMLFRGNSAAVVIGAGTSFGNGGDDFSWLDVWSVLEAQPQSSRDSASPAADRLLVAKSESASALIFLKDGRPQWQQEGD